ncbi:hypothetical protein F53441_8521 [Fusarium austroafricanum]|uniref:Cutinase n=1 Tax=Fusarium austroafricanum TaxID=2364996 RepID=A0A8H4NXA2_9HYPO|nr:hypothetical protein F53441_8521 [Fusarium austroafricanum]
MVLLFSSSLSPSVGRWHCYAADTAIIHREVASTGAGTDTGAGIDREYRALPLWHWHWHWHWQLLMVTYLIYYTCLSFSLLFPPSSPHSLFILSRPLSLNYIFHIKINDTATMLAFMLVLSLFLALATAAKPPAYTINTITCAKSAHIIVARGSLEPQGPGAMGAIAEQILKLIPGSDMEALVYPALYDEYVESQTEGVRAMTALVNNYAKNCPHTDIILMAHVTMDTMCGASSKGFPPSLPQPSYITDKVAAIIAMGDPSLTEGQSFHVGTSQGSGIFPRNLPVGCDRIARKAVSFCDKGDPYCEAGGKDLAVHLSYIKVYGEFTVNHVVKTLKSRG